MRDRAQHEEELLHDKRLPFVSMAVEPVLYHMVVVPAFLAAVTCLCPVFYFRLVETVNTYVKL